MRRIAELDGVRGLAALTVVAYHMFINRMPWGWAAVDVFFVLSGFLITGIVLEHGRAPGFLWSFYARRGLRIWPIYYMLFLILAFYWVEDPRALPYYLTYTQQTPRYLGGVMPRWGAMAHCWTLALEEQFYLVWPVLVLWAGRRRTIWAALAVAFGSIAARGQGVHYWLLIGRCDGFALGGLLAAILADPEPARARRRALACALAAGAIAALIAVGLGLQGTLLSAREASALRWHVTVAGLASFALVAVIATNAGGRLLAPLRTRPLVYLGTISYGLYLYHNPIVMSSFELRALLGIGPGPLLWGTELLLTLLVAAVSWELIEKPLLRLKAHIPYQAGPPVPGIHVVPADPPRELIGVSVA